CWLWRGSRGRFGHRARLAPRIAAPNERGNPVQTFVLWVVGDPTHEGARAALFFVLLDRARSDIEQRRKFGSWYQHVAVGKRDVHRAKPPADSFHQTENDARLEIGQPADTHACLRVCVFACYLRRPMAREKLSTPGSFTRLVFASCLQPARTAL